MLVLTRTLQEKVIVGNDIEITIIAIEGKKVKVGIKAPEGIPINRPEVIARDPALLDLHMKCRDQQTT